MALLSSPPGTTARDLADYISTQVAAIHGPQLPCPGKDAIIEGFAQRFGSDAMRIARQAFGPHRGWWMGAPVTERRFAASQDEFFALPLQGELGS